MGINTVNCIGRKIWLFILVCVCFEGAVHPERVWAETLQTDSRLSSNVPYTPDSPWNLKIGPDPVYAPNSDFYMESLHGVFGSDTSRYTLPVYEVDGTIPLVTITLSDFFSNVTWSGGEQSLEVTRKVAVQVPIPLAAVQAKGKDGQMVIWNVETGDEWGFWRIEKKSGKWVAQNGYHYNTQWSGVPPTGFVSRGAGVPYLTGLIRPWEIKQGRIDHAIALGVNYPNMLHIYPATKSDGKTLDHFFPAGARFQLNPSLTDLDFETWGLDRTGRIIAKALQDYGMILVDGSGHPKIYGEYDGTAHWDGVIHKNSVRNIPYEAFQLLTLETPEAPSPPGNIKVRTVTKGIGVTWDASSFATRYRIWRIRDGESQVLLNSWVETRTYVDTEANPGEEYIYLVAAVNHNGVGSAASSSPIAY